MDNEPMIEAAKILTNKILTANGTNTGRGAQALANGLGSILYQDKGE